MSGQKKHSLKSAEDSDKDSFEPLKLLGPAQEAQRQGLPAAGAKGEDVVSDADEDIVINISLRPKKIPDFIGQKELIGNLKVCLTAAKQRKEPLEHVLFSGPPGLGKTSLSQIVAREMNAKITSTSGPAIERAGDLIGILTNLERGDILFIDEIHRLSKVVEEFLYPAMESFQIDFVIDKGPYAKTIKFNLKPFTLVGATTRVGLLTAPLRERFGIFYHLDFYNSDDLARIVSRSAKILNLEIEDDAAREIAKRARGTPRVANRLLRRVRDYAQVEGASKITSFIASRTLDELGVDRAGFDDMDRKVLKRILEHYDGGPVGIESLAASLNEEADTVIDTVEPYLLKTGYIKRTHRGRIVTKRAYEHFGIRYEKQEELF